MGDRHAPVPYESHPRRRTTGRRAGPPVPGGAAGPRAAGPARGLRRSGQAPGPPAVPPDNRLVQQAHAPGGHMPAGSTRLSSRHGMKSWRTDDESSRGTDLTATRTELNNISASGAAPFRKHGRKYSPFGAICRRFVPLSWAAQNRPIWCVVIGVVDIACCRIGAGPQYRTGEGSAGFDQTTPDDRPLPQSNGASVRIRLHYGLAPASHPWASAQCSGASPGDPQPTEARQKAPALAPTCRVQLVQAMVNTWQPGIMK